MTAIKQFKRFTLGLRVFLKDIGHGCFEITHNGFAVVGLLTALAVGALVYQPQLRQTGEAALYTWLHERQIVPESITAEPDAIERATATHPNDLPKEQAAIAFWIAKKYKVAPEPVGALVSHAYEIGIKTKIEPTLILAIMAVESSFNPFAQSPVGAQGLMQVMTKVHTEKYQSFGGNLAAFDPLTNLRVGVKVLQECIKRAGSIEGGLRQYVGATSDATEGGYTLKVLAEQERLRMVAKGDSVPWTAPVTPAATPVLNPQEPMPEAEEKVAAL